MESNHEAPLTSSVQYVPGVGPARARLLAKLGLHTVEDLLWNMPRDVLDLSEVRPPAELAAGQLQTVRGKVADVDGRELSGGRSLSAVLIDCGGEYVRGSWFNQLWVLKKFQIGQHVLFSGKPKRQSGRWEFAHPRVQWLEDDSPDAHGGALPRYSLTDGLKMEQMRHITREAVSRYVDEVPEYLPKSFLQSQKLPHIQQAIRGLHTPGSLSDYEEGRTRLIFDDLLEFELAIALRRRAWKLHREAPVLPTTAKIDARIRRLFPFAFTPGQNRAVQEISADLQNGRAMHRLLQADVGAGKTAVALYAMLVAVAAGYQAVMMAPTEVLASQHWDTLEETLRHSRVNRLLLTGDLKPSARKKALAQIAAGEAQLVVGTQAVIQKDVRFHRLGIAVIDEQHKFGVAQRAHFALPQPESPPNQPQSATNRLPPSPPGRGAGGEGNPSKSPAADSAKIDNEPSKNVTPHVLVMTATPIPRSLCLTQFGDLDITTIDDLPPGRQPTITSRVAGEASAAKAWNFVREQLHAGRQAFVVCPRIEASNAGGDNELASAEHWHQQLNGGELKDFRVGLVHGQMDQSMRSRVMDAFRGGKIHALVSTTVIEVGVDIPNATLMVVLQAERFGLSQLHQLRGRIGRGNFRGYCFLFSESDSPEALQRLRALESTSDGFKIAEVDFELRGPGDVLGTRQHGEMPLRVADLNRDAKILTRARKQAFRLVDSNEFDRPEFAPLKRRVLERFGQMMDLPQTG